jgi:hypothetical protein
MKIRSAYEFSQFASTVSNPLLDTSEEGGFACCCLGQLFLTRAVTKRGQFMVMASGCDDHLGNHD